MLSKFVVSVYSVLLEVGLWLILILGFISGWSTGGIIGAIVGLVVSAIFGAIMLGMFLVIDDIRKKVTAIESKK